MRAILETMRRYQMIGRGMHVVAGVSGGADSVCLLLALCEYRKELEFGLTVVHVEHGLRGEESLADARFTRELCEKLSVPCRVVHAQVARRAREEGISHEEAGRLERYRIFEEVRGSLDADRIAVAHNRRDQAETVLWNLVRGSGLRGLAGMRPVNGRIIRPLLFTGRERIEEILTEAGVAWRTDCTNLEQEYTRNRIRLSVLPLLSRELNEGAERHIAEAADRLGQAEDFIRRMTDGAAARCIRAEEGSVRLLLPAFFAEDELICRELLRRAVGMCGGLRDFGSVHMEALLHLCTLDCGREACLPGRITAVREEGSVRFFREAGRDAPSGKTAREDSEPERRAGPGESAAHPGCGFAVSVPGEILLDGCRVRTALCDNSPGLMCQIMEEKKYTKWFSYDTIDKNTLRLRRRLPGDYLVINAQGGRKKLKDYLIDLRIPRRQRDRLWLLADGPHVLWVLGYRISEAAKVREDTRKVIKVQLEEENR